MNTDVKAKLERSRQSARECRARKKLRYQYLEELVTEREKAVFHLRKELDKVVSLYEEMNGNTSSHSTTPTMTNSSIENQDYLEKVCSQYRQWSKEIDEGKVPEGFEALLETFFDDPAKNEQ